MSWQSQSLNLILDKWFALCQRKIFSNEAIISSYIVKNWHLDIYIVEKWIYKNSNKQSGVSKCNLLNKVDNHQINSLVNKANGKVGYYNKIFKVKHNHFLIYRLWIFCGYCSVAKLKYRNLSEVKFCQDYISIFKLIISKGNRQNDASLR